MSYFSLNKLNKIIKTHKDTIPQQSKKNVVYRIDCEDCDVSYVGQTGRKLSIRIKEHNKHINRNTTNKSVITEHRINLNHNFKWEDITILDTENHYNKRLISEMIHIKRQKNSLNLQTDTESLPTAYDNIINNLPKNRSSLGRDSYINTTDNVDLLISHLTLTQNDQLNTGYITDL